MYLFTRICCARLRAWAPGKCSVPEAPGHSRSEADSNFKIKIRDKIGYGGDTRSAIVVQSESTIGNIIAEAMKKVGNDVVITVEEAKTLPWPTSSRAFVNA